MGQTYRTGETMKTILVFFIFALSSLVIRDGMGCFPNVLDAEWRLNIFGPKIDRNFKSRFQEGIRYQKTEKDLENGEAYDKIEPLDSNQIDITGTLQLPEENSLKLKILKIWKGFGYTRR